ncbi:hypothetical protein T265_13735, partial [Opisthorchis viverrini]
GSARTIYDIIYCAQGFTGVIRYIGQRRRRTSNRHRNKNSKCKHSDLASRSMSLHSLPASPLWRSRGCR